MDHDLWNLLAELSPDILATTDGDGTLTFVSAASRLLGWSVEELIGRPLTTIIPEWLHTIEGQPFHRAVLTQPRSATGGVRSFIVHRTGAESEVEVHAVAAGARGDDEELFLFIFRMLHASAEFTSYPSESRAPAMDQEQLYRVVFERAPVGLVHFDARGVITAVNDTFSSIVGATPRTIIGLNMLTLPYPQIVDCVKEAVAGYPSHYEGEYKALLSGKVTLARVVFTPTFDAEGNVTGGVGIVDDTTEQQMAQRALARAERMASLGTLAAGVTHEINNPLSFTMAGVELSRRLVRKLRETPDQAVIEKIETSLDDAYEGIERVRTIIRDLKTFARSAEEQRAAVDIEQVLDIAIKLTRTEVRHKARVEREHGNVPLVAGSEPRLVQLFVNLLVNAAHAIEEGRLDENKIRLVTRAHGDDKVLIEVHDTGVGIATRDIERVFEPFWTDRRDGGVGLGLSICHGIVMAHGGEITVESEPGKGSVFKVILPRSDATELVDRSERVTLITPPSPSETLSVLIVDDEEALGRTLQLGLSSLHHVTVVTSGHEALALIKEGETFDVVLCDLMLPDLPGPDLYDEALNFAPDLASRFVFMTGGAFTDKARDFLQRVPNKRLEKPFLLTELESVLAGLAPLPDHEA